MPVGPEQPAPAGAGLNSSGVLIAVSGQGLLDPLGFHTVDGSGAPQVSLPLLAQTECQMARPAPTVLHLALAREAKALFRSLMGLLLWHGLHRTSLVTIGKTKICYYRRSRVVEKGDWPRDRPVQRKQYPPSG